MPRMLDIEQITLDWLKSATLEDLKNAMRSGGDVLNAVNALLITPDGKKIAYEMMNDPDYVPFSQRQPDPEEAAQIEADKAEAERQAAEAESQRQADELAAQQQPPAETPVVEPPKVEEKKKYVIDYQVTDEDTGRPIGRATHFEAFGTELEAAWALIDKLKQAHINAARYAERIKSNKFKQSAASLEATERSVAARNAQAESERLAVEAANEKDPEKMKAAVKKAADAERDARIAQEANMAHGRIIANTWMVDHKDDFVPCDASTNIIGEYLKANNLILSYDNLEKAFQAVKHQLPSVPTGQQASATEVTKPVAVVDNSQQATAAAPAASSTSIPSTAAPATVKETISQPPAAPPAAATAQASTSATSNQTTVARKPVVNGGLQPGQLSARRPSESSTQQTPEATRSQLLREIGKMDPAIYRKKLTTDKNFRDRLIAAGIPVAGSRS